MARRIHLKGNYRHEENNAGEAGIYPGMLVSLNSDNEVIKHAVEGGYAEAIFAEEDALQGNTVDTVYTSGRKVMQILPDKAGVINALLKGGYDYAIGDQLISAGDGTLKKATDITSGETVKQIIAVKVEEALALNDSDDANGLGKVRIL